MHDTLIVDYIAASAMHYIWNLNTVLSRSTVNNIIFFVKNHPEELCNHNDASWRHITWFKIFVCHPSFLCRAAPNTNAVIIWYKVVGSIDDCILWNCSKVNKMWCQWWIDFLNTLKLSSLYFPNALLNICIYPCADPLIA